LIQKETIRSFIHPFLLAPKPQKAFYGWHWWTSSFSDETGNNTETDYYYALGFGGQYIVVIPSFDMVVVVTADRFKKKQPPVDIFPPVCNTAAASAVNLHQKGPASVIRQALFCNTTRYQNQFPAMCMCNRLT
jgi:CubicO group peptidase (beta-lactamase class C family)